MSTTLMAKPTTTFTLTEPPEQGDYEEEFYDQEEIQQGAYVRTDQDSRGTP